MTKETIDRIKALNAQLAVLLNPTIRPKYLDTDAIDRIYREIRHLAYPDRDVYPKTRRGTKGAPIVRR